MLTKPPTCAGCPLEHKGLGFVPDKLAPSPKYVFHGETPGKHEILQDEPFVGKAGFVLKEWGLRSVPLLQLALERGEVSLVNTLRCLPPEKHGRAYPTGEEKRLCEAHCRVHDTPTDPGVTHILLGEVPQRHLFVRELAQEDTLDRSQGRDLKGVLGRIGRVYEQYDVGTVTGDRVSFVYSGRYVFAPHPAAVLRSPFLVQHLQAALRIAAQTHKTIEVWSSPAPLDYRVTDPHPHKNIGFDMEWSAKVTTVGFAWNGGKSAFAAPRTNLSFDLLPQELSMFNSVSIHNGLAADLRQLQKEGLDVSSLQTKVFDTMLAMHATHAHLAGTGSYDIRSSVLLCGEVAGERFPLDWKNYATDIYKTCREDAAAALWITGPLKRKIAAEGLGPTVALSHEIAPIFALMHGRGVRLDKTALESIHTERKRSVEEITAKYQLTETRGIKKLRTVPIWRSDKILDKFQSLFGHRPPDRTRKTWLSLSRNAGLSQEARDFALALVDLGTGANDAHWLGRVETENEDGSELTFEKVSDNGYIYPEYHIHGSPDRPIAKRPNVQNFPRPSDDPRSTPLRACVVPPGDGQVLCSVDYSSIETFTSALEADDWDMVRAIQRGSRSHERTAEEMSKIAGLPLTRQQGKTINHAFDKGESPFNLAKRLFGSSVTRVQKANCLAIYTAMLKQYPKSREFRDQLWDRAQSNPLVVANKFGRRLSCFARSRYGEERDWDARHDKKLTYWCPCKACAPRRERWKFALAFLGRSLAADILLRVMARIWREKRLGDYSLPYLEVHDELVYAVPAGDRAPVYLTAVVIAFEDFIPELGIALPASGHLGKNWAEAK
jgi:uracil-DNA glycosylase family 4